jgi:ribosomal-protein-alanine N-acetyltransferase
MAEIATPRLLFRRFTSDDLQNVWTIRSDPEVMKYIGAGRPESVSEVQAILNKILTQWEQHGFGPWALIDKENGDLIGWCGLRYLDDTGDVEIAYGIAKAYWGQGLASEAATATIKYGFDQLQLPRIVAVACPDNLTSLRVLEKLGMKYVKVAHFYNADVLYYAISREEHLAERLR